MPGGSEEAADKQSPTASSTKLSVTSLSSTSPERGSLFCNSVNRNSGSELRYNAPKLLERVSAMEDASPERPRSLQHVYSMIANDRCDVMQNPSNQSWQDFHFTQSAKLANLYSSQLNSDVTFAVGAAKVPITAHKFVLSVASPVFEVMFTSHWQESSADDISIPDVEPEAFRRLVKFAYTDAVALDEANVFPILFAANKYLMKTLSYLCVEFLGESLSASNCFALLDQSLQLATPFLTGLCLQQIDCNTAEALESEAFLDISLDTLKTIIGRNSLKTTELGLFNAVHRWLQTECGRRGIEASANAMREILGDSIKEIRFPLMTEEDIARYVAPSGLLDDKVLVALFRYFIVKDNDLIAGFKTIPRALKVMDEEIIINRFQRIESRWGYSGTPDRVKFQVDAPINLKGFGLYGSMSRPHTYQVLMEISRSNNGMVVARAERSLTTTGTNETFRVLFDNPVDILPNTLYIASVTMTGPDSFYGSKGLRRIVKTAGSRPTSFQFAYAAGNNNGSSVDDGQIPEFIFSTKPV